VAKRSFRLDPALPTLLITGGSSGAVGINEWVFEHVQELCEHANVVHLTGKSKGDPDVSHQRYHQEEFLHGDMFHMMAASDVIISRAGISTISELAAIGKAAVIVPMPKTHQEENAFFVARSHAARVFRQDQMNERFMDEVLRLLSRKDARAELEKQLQSLAKPAARQRYIALIETSNQHAAPEI